MNDKKVKARKYPTWIALGGAAALVAAILIRSSEPEKPKSDRRTRNRSSLAWQRPMELAPEDASPAARAESHSQKAPSEESSRMAEEPRLSVPANIESDVVLLQAWILGLPEAEFARMVGTQTLDRLVGRVVDLLTPRTTEVAPPREIDEFLFKLNARVQSSLATRKS